VPFQRITLLPRDPTMVAPFDETSVGMNPNRCTDPSHLTPPAESVPMSVRPSAEMPETLKGKVATLPFVQSKFDPASTFPDDEEYGAPCGQFWQATNSSSGNDCMPAA